MKKSINLIIILFLILSALSTSMYGEIYSIVNSKQKVIGKTDCWLVKYSLWEDHGTMNPHDDTKIGEYTTVVGDCSDASFRNGLIDISKSKTFDYFIYPNPTNDFLNISISNKKKSNYIKWVIYNLYGDKMQSGTFDLKNSSSEIKMINTGYLNNGTYILEIIDGDNITSNKIVINK